MPFDRDDHRLALAVLAGLPEVPPPIASAIRDGDWGTYLTFKVDPRVYSDPVAYFSAAQAVALYKKHERLPVKGVDRKLEAYKKWCDGESACYTTNQRLAPIKARLFGSAMDHDYSPELDAAMRIVLKARKIIEGWIGDRPPALLAGKHGPGATFHDKSIESTLIDKMASNPTRTPDSWPFLFEFFGTAWGSALAQRSGEIAVVPGNRFTTAPKTALVDRPIAVEPSINVFYQLGYGSSLKNRLKHRAGWCMAKAQYIHRRVAREASVSRSFCTIDLSNASDTVAKTLVQVLLPSRWFEALSALRSPRTLIPGRYTGCGDQWRVLEKFSSMGNGFTFELETIIFAGLTQATLELNGRSETLGKGLYVYGDDIIAPDESYREIRAVLNWFGFTLNDDKSFSGDTCGFRESCGADFFNGVDVRPVSIKKLLTNPVNQIAAANQVTTLMKRLSEMGQDCSRMRAAWFGILDRIPTRFRSLRGPERLGDVCIHDSREYWITRLCKETQIEWVKVLNITPTFKSADGLDPDTYLACALYGGLDPVRGVIPRNGRVQYNHHWVSCS